MFPEHLIASVVFHFLNLDDVPPRFENFKLIIRNRSGEFEVSCQLVQRIFRPVVLPFIFTLILPNSTIVNVSWLQSQR